MDLRSSRDAFDIQPQWFEPEVYRFAPDGVLTPPDYRSRRRSTSAATRARMDSPGSRAAASTCPASTTALSAPAAWARTRWVGGALHIMHVEQAMATGWSWAAALTRGSRRASAGWLMMQRRVFTHPPCME